ncbi:PD-(D/E)XK motif protein [Variovorax sp. GB1P17]|uniref:PD-(D/E)XK motif protein n=1 Tax=Variovorax sp. GB1P17 TaxID=3443740 RepID=UPI003F4757A8
MEKTSMIESQWAELVGALPLPVHRRVSPYHPLDLFAQLDSQERVGLLAISEETPGTVPTYAAVDVSVGLRADGKWATSISLKQPILRPMFAAMCDEIVQQGMKAKAGVQAGGFVLQLLARWQRLLALGPDGLLSSEARLGLLGELAVLSKAIHRFGSQQAIQGWLGPLDAPQDFLLPSGFVEVKAIRNGSSEIRISSLEQLDISSDALTLAVCEFASCSAGTGGYSLASLVSMVRERVVDHAEVADTFEGLLRQAGFTDRSEYAQEEFRLLRTRWFSVTAEFPRLQRSKLPQAVSAGKYRLLLESLEPFETSWEA